jgi:NADH-quinone oxidoreductase subunit C
LIPVYAGANWHEREAFEMFGIQFEGHPRLIHLYLPDSFIGNPLRKSFPLLSREVKPWPGTVDVEAMPGRDDDEPSTENPEA